ncbi:MAG: mevalonate kinase [Proteobacteria bacterium]|jgi:mevalonate kinase|nr:mevalonate kinase [Pseudomonadota bacterium]
MSGGRDNAVGRAGGKVILLGEHAVVHGAAAIAIGIPGKTSVTACRARGPASLRVEGWGLDARADGGDPADVALRGLLGALEAPLEGLSLRGETALPARAGLGASASIAAASARAAAALLGLIPTAAELHAAVQASERAFHGNPSGVDAAAVLGEGVLRFSRDAGATRLDVQAPELVIVHTGAPGDTRVTVAAFAAKISAEPVEAARRLEAIRGIVERGVAALGRRDAVALGRLMDENHEQLAWFGVSTAALDRACAAARDAGALGAKLTGGGGGGCAIALVAPRDRARVAAALGEAGFALVPV